MNCVKCVTMYPSHIYKNPDLGRYSTVLYLGGKDIPLLITLGELGGEILHLFVWVAL